MKNYLLFLLFFLSSAGLSAQVQSPEQFLGYQLGTRYTPHYRIAAYFQHVAQAASENVKLQVFGETNEHRPLLAAFVSSKNNISNLEEIRKNNLALARMNDQKPSADAPVIIWLSYNVHGNETSSSEAAMETLYTLVNPENGESKKWLENSVVVIDPCLNPDGRDRYINWYNTMIGKNWNPYPMAREHMEEWPRGRSNHYNYDLNRDWVWQTQVESRQRVALYNQWLPQIHVDFHEQGVNAPYYFAPGAEPYHEVITGWQRDFQKTIGENNAKYFDKNNWLFFTRERFDLFYPSYGDTYPLYNGSIGMTYEQGGISAGLGILTNDKDTLSLTDRILHHYTSGLSTIEISSKNAQRLVDEFHSYFNNGITGRAGEYKTYVVKNRPEDVQRIQSLMNLLDQNGIRYGTSAGTAKGFNYETQKEESFSIENNDLVISGLQPKSVMVKVLFEPSSKLVDSVTYDITAWALPYAYGLTAYATKQVFKVNESEIFDPFKNNIPENVYGYAIRWQGLQSVKAVGKLLGKGFRVRYSEVSFTAGGESFDKGTIIITRNGNQQLGEGIWNQVASVCNNFGLKMYPLHSGMVDKGSDFGSDMIHVIKPVHVALLTGQGVWSGSAGEIWDYFDNQIDYPVTLINQKSFDRIDLNDFDVVVMPGGTYDFLKNKKSSAKLERWIKEGGKIIAFENAVSQLAKQDWNSLKLKTDTTHKKDTGSYDLLKKYEFRERDEITESLPGAIYKVEIDNSHPLMFGYPAHYYSLKTNSDIYEFTGSDGWNAGFLRKENHMAGFAGSAVQEKLKDGVLFSVQELGKGSVINFTDNIIFRNFWETGKLMLANAVFLVN